MRERASQRQASRRRASLLGAAISAFAVVAVVVWALGQPAPELPTGNSGLALFAAAIGLYGVDMVLRSVR